MANAVAIPNLTVGGGLQGLALGVLGADYVTDTTITDGAPNNIVWGIITAITAATFTTLNTTSVSTNRAAPANMNGLVLAAGQSIYGRFTLFTLTSGSVIAYRVQTQ